MASSRSSHSSSGFSLVELLVVMFILSIVSAIAAVGISRGLQADREAQSRIEAFEDMQIALERISREVRATATPLDDVVLDGDVDPDYDPGQGIELEVLRDGEGSCVRIGYWMDEAGNLRGSQERSTDSCATFAPASETIVITGLDPESDVFRFETSEYVDGERLPADTPADIRFVTITFTRTLVGQDPVTVSTVVGLRNA